MYILFGILGLLGAAIFLVLIIVSLLAKKKMKRNVICFFLCSIVFFVCISIPTENSDQRQTVQKPVTEEDEEENSREEIEDPAAISDQRPSTANNSVDTSDYMNIDADVLFEYNGYLSGENIVTVITVESVDEHFKMLKAKTSNSDSLFFSIVCEFSDESAIADIKKEDVLTVAGTLKEQNGIAETVSFLDTPTASLENCTIIGHGEIAADLKTAVDEQIQICEEVKQAYDRQIQEDQAASRENYISQCETVKYSSVERNPDDYDGKQIKISGKVIQVSEGWFDSVTLRIDSNGDVWLVTYYRSEKESRILENDVLTCYGKCTGVTSYKTVLGSTLTIPSMDMEYYD